MTPYKLYFLPIFESDQTSMAMLVLANLSVTAQRYLYVPLAKDWHHRFPQTYRLTKSSTGIYPCGETTNPLVAVLDTVFDPKSETTLTIEDPRVALALFLELGILNGITLVNSTTYKWTVRRGDPLPVPFRGAVLAPPEDGIEYIRMTLLHTPIRCDHDRVPNYSCI